MSKCNLYRNSQPNMANMTAAALMAISLLFSAMGFAESVDSDAGIIAIDNQGTLVTFAGGNLKSTGTLIVRIDGPDGLNVFEAKSESGLVDWALDSGLKDGIYSYDAWYTPSDLTVPTAKSPEQATMMAADPAMNQSEVLYQPGMLRIKDGLAEPYEPSLSKELEHSGIDVTPSFLERLAGGLLEFLVPSAHAIQDFNEDLRINDGTPEFLFNDNTDTTVAWDWTLQGFDNLFTIRQAFVADVFNIQPGAGANAMFIESGGDIGLGTSTPDTVIQINDTFPNISFIDSDNGNKDYELLNNGGIFFLIDRSTGAIPFNVQNNTSGFALTVNNSNVGVGNFVSPAKQLHVQGNDASALTNNNVQLRVENTSGTVERRDLLALSNNGGVKFTMEDRDRGDIWDFSTRSNGFNINLLGTGGQELLVTPLGEFRVGPGGVQNFVVKPNGDVFVDGSLVHSSSRDTKEQISPVDSGTVLAKLERLEVAEWSYKDAVGGERHLSPMAEDFHGLFGLGPDNKHVSPSDLAGVALAAAKALKADNDAKDQRIAELEARMARLEALIAD